MPRRLHNLWSTRGPSAFIRCRQQETFNLLSRLPPSHITTAFGAPSTRCFTGFVPQQPLIVGSFLGCNCGSARSPPALMTTAARSAPVPSLGPVKMEDRKRSIVADADASAPPTKRQAVNGVKSHADADMPWKDDLEVGHPQPYRRLPLTDLPAHTLSDRQMRLTEICLQTFQKDAIMRQMKEYKREKETLENRIKTMEERKQYHDDHLRLIDLWFTQASDVLVDAHSQLSDFLQLTDELRAICNDMISKQPTDPSTY